MKCRICGRDHHYVPYKNHPIWCNECAEKKLQAILKETLREMVEDMKEEAQEK